MSRTLRLVIKEEGGVAKIDAIIGSEDNAWERIKMLQGYGVNATYLDIEQNREDMSIDIAEILRKRRKADGKAGTDD